MSDELLELLRTSVDRGAAFTIKPLGMAHWPERQVCPLCGGTLQPCFGQMVRDDGVRLPVIDPTVGSCRECYAQFTVKA